MSDRQERINNIITEALAQVRRSRPARRHPADVTADRLGDAMQRWDFDGAERDAIGVVINALRRVSERGE